VAAIGAAVLATREDIFPDYAPGAFEKEFGRYFTVLRCQRINESERTLYLMQRRSS